MVSHPILNAKPHIALEDFLNKCGAIHGVDVGLVREIANATITYLRGNKGMRQKMETTRTLEQQWYASLSNGKPDWNVYGTDYYLGELWACWIIYSRQYLLSMLSPRSFANGGIIGDIGQVKKVVDLGCGCGYTTAAFREIFPHAEVIGTNLDGIAQTEVARQMGRQYGFQVVSDIHDINAPADMIFASEYFEHIYAPVQHIRDVISTLKPRVLVMANAFDARAIGHFDYYNVDGKPTNGKTTSKRFSYELQRYGFTKVKTNLWNNRPAYWKQARRIL